MQAAQACHALQQFNVEHREQTEIWYKNSNNLVLLSVANEEELLALQKRCANIATSLFREPDIDNEATALAIDSEGKRHTRNFSLLLKGLTNDVVKLE